MTKKKWFLVVMICLWSMTLLCAAGAKESGTTQKVAQQDDVQTLYELAKEEGKVVVYSVSSRIKTAASSFMEQYPGVVVEAYDMRMPAIIEKLEREAAAGVKNADVILGNDNGGSLTLEALPSGLVEGYIPSDMKDTISAAFKESPFFDFTVELVTLFYNNEVYAESPVKSWWDLTRPEWKGKILMPDPMSAPELLSLFGAFSLHADEMAADYQRVFGKPLVLNNSVDAGYEFMRRLLANDVVIVDSQGGAVKAIGAAGQTNPSLCIVVSSKLRERSTGLHIAIATELTPVVGMANPNSLIMVQDCPHPNAAKLLIRWIAGEKDGTGAGYDGFKVVGGWPTRYNGVNVSDQPLSDLKYWVDDRAYMYKNGLKLRDAWLAYQN